MGLKNWVMCTGERIRDLDFSAGVQNAEIAD